MKTSNQKTAISTKIMQQVLHGLQYVLFASCWLLLAPNANAAGFDLSVSPPIFQAELTPPSNAQVKEQLILENSGDEPLDLKIVFRHFKPASENGQVEYLKETETPGADPLIFQRISVEEDGQRLERVIVPPKTTKKYNLHISVPKDEPPSDYYFTILFINDAATTTNNDSSSDKDGPSGSMAVGGIGTNVLLSIGPKGTTTGSIEEFSTPFLQGGGPVPFVVRVKNTSKHFIYPKANIEITNMFGQRIGVVDLLPLNILSGTTRAMPSREQFVFESQKQRGQLDEKTLDKLAKNSTGSPLLAIWPEEFLLGPYTATLTIALSSEGPIYHRSILFIGFPALLLLGFIISIGVVLLIRSRLKTRG